MASRFHEINGEAALLIIFKEIERRPIFLIVYTYNGMFCNPGEFIFGKRYGGVFFFYNVILSGSNIGIMDFNRTNRLTFKYNFYKTSGLRRTSGIGWL